MLVDVYLGKYLSNQVQHFVRKQLNKSIGLGWLRTPEADNEYKNVQQLLVDLRNHVR